MLVAYLMAETKKKNVNSMVNDRQKQSKPLVYVIEDFHEQRDWIAQQLHARDYKTKKFPNRKQAHAEAYNALRRGRPPVAVVTDFATEKDDMKLQDFLNQMNIRFPSTAVFISTVYPSLVETEHIIMPLSTAGVFQRVSGMEELLERLAGHVSRQEERSP